MLKKRFNYWLRNLKSSILNKKRLSNSYKDTHVKKSSKNLKSLREIQRYQFLDGFQKRWLSLISIREYGSHQPSRILIYHCSLSQACVIPLKWMNSLYLEVSTTKLKVNLVLARKSSKYLKSQLIPLSLFIQLSFKLQWESKEVTSRHV